MDNIIIEAVTEVQYEGDLWSRYDRGDHISNLINGLGKDCFDCGGTINIFNGNGKFNGVEVSLLFKESEFVS